MTHKSQGRFSLQALEEHGYSAQFIREWRKREHNAGKPSQLSDFLTAHGFCSHCKALGENYVGRDGDDYVAEWCEVCGGTGVVGTRHGS